MAMEVSIVAVSEGLNDDCLSLPASTVRAFDFAFSAIGLADRKDGYFVLAVTRGAKTVEVVVRLHSIPCTVAHALMRAGEHEMAVLALEESAKGIGPE